MAHPCGLAIIPDPGVRDLVAMDLLTKLVAKIFPTKIVGYTDILAEDAAWREIRGVHGKPAGHGGSPA